MSVYLEKRNKTWMYDFVLQGQRYVKRGFKTKREANQEEALKRREVKKGETTPMELTDINFIELVNRRLDYVKNYNSASHYRDYVYMAKRWVAEWGDIPCQDITQTMIENFVLWRSEVSPHVANKEIRYLRATFNFGIKRKIVKESPLNGMDFLPVEKRIKYVPPVEDVIKVIALAKLDDQDYLWSIVETMARVSEINRLVWDDVDLQNKTVTLYTRKKKGGHLTPRNIPMTKRLYEIMSRRFNERDQKKPWVFWHCYRSSREGHPVEGPYLDRKRIMRTLCKKAGVRYFRFHALRHLGASLLDSSSVPISTIQQILGHENRTTTEIYLHSIGNSLWQAMDQYENSWEKSHQKSHQKSHPS